MGPSAGNLAPAKQRLYEQLVDALHVLFAVHPGYRPVHAKGVVCEGTFHPAATAVSVSRAPRLQSAPLRAGWYLSHSRDGEERRTDTCQKTIWTN